MATPHAQPALAAPRRTRGGERDSTHARSGAFWLIAFTFLTAMAFSAVPTPLYPIYMQHDGFSTFTVTIVFAVYAVGVVSTLMFFGHASDTVGRRTVLGVALILELIAGAIFLLWPELPAIIAARFVSGLGIGLVTASATAYLSELNSLGRGTESRFEIVSTMFNTGGLGVGPLIAGALATFVGAPLRVPYGVFLGLLALALCAVLASPETVKSTSGRLRPRLQRIAVAREDLLTYVAGIGGAVLAFAYFGLATSLAPGFIGDTLHEQSHLLEGVVVFAVFAAGAAAQLGTAKFSAGSRFATGLVSLAVGLVGLAVGMKLTSFAAFLAGAAVAGAGGGVLFKSAIATISALADPDKRGETLAGVFLGSYLGLIMPVIGIGVMTRSMSATTAMMWFTGVLLALLIVVAVMASFASRSAGAPDRDSEEAGT